MVHDDGPVGLDAMQVSFDDERAVSDAGIVLVATLAQRLGIEALAAALRAPAARAARCDEQAVALDPRERRLTGGRIDDLARATGASPVTSPTSW